MEPIQNLIFRDSNKHIAAISFSSPKAKSLKEAKEWKDIPRFSVITGLNGSGKSHLFEHTSHELSQKRLDINYPYRHIYLHSNHDDMSMSYEDASERKRQLKNQLYYDVKGKGMTDEVLTSVREKLTNGEFLRDHPNFNVEQFLQDLKNSPIREIDNNLDYQTLEQLVDKHLAYYVSGNRSISLLNTVIRDYNNIKRDDCLSQNPEESELLGYATNNRELLFPGRYPDDEAMGKDFHNIQSEVKVKYLEVKLSEELADSPLKEINDILRKYQFNFELKENPNKGEIRQFWLRRLDLQDSPDLEPIDLSSGEKKILEMLGWFYYYSSQKPYDERRVSIMLLDEPDRHLDPDLLAVFLQIIYEEFVKGRDVQVFMSTHRPDTIQLVPEESIFMLERHSETGVSEVVPVYRLHALYCLLKNLRQLTSIQLKVWTEAINDASFYTAIYHCLLDYNEEERDRMRKKIVFKHVNGEEYEYQFLSRRYTLSFVQVSDEKGKNGGCSKFKACILMDRNVLKNLEIRKGKKKKQNKAIFDPRIFNSFAIVDNDGRRKEHFERFEEENLQDRIVVPTESYSLENFLLNPFILCSGLSPEQAGQFVKYKLKNGKKEQPEENKTSEITIEDNKQQEDQVLEKEKEFTGICKKINEEIENIREDSIVDIQKLQSYVDEYCEFLKEVVNHNRGKHAHQNPQDEKSDVNILLLGGLNQVITIKYPTKFLRLKGHDLFDNFIKPKMASELVQQLTDGLSQKELKCIPQELAEVIFSLNDLAKKSCKTPKIRKPDA